MKQRAAMTKTERKTCDYLKACLNRRCFSYEEVGAMSVHRAASSESVDTTGLD